MARESAVTFFCFLDSELSPMAHMEPLDADTLEDARCQAGRLLKRHRSAQAARIYLDAEEIAILKVEGARS